MNLDFLSSTWAAGVDYLQQVLATALGTDNQNKDEKKDEENKDNEVNDIKQQNQAQPQEEALVVEQTEVETNQQEGEESLQATPVISDAERKSDEHFDADYMADLFKSCLDNDLKTVNASDFILACKQVPKLMAGMGNTLKLGNSKLYEKINWMEKRLDEAAQDLGQPKTRISLQDMIERDIAHKWTHTGKPTNHATRNIVRLIWFLDFITALFRAVAEEDPAKSSMKKILTDVYKQSLGTHHPYAVRKLTETGIRVGPIPSRATFANHIGFGDLTLAQQNAKLLEWAETTDKVAIVMWQYIDSKKLRDVP